MNLAATLKSSKAVLSAVAMAAAVAVPNVAKADAVAQAYLDISNFKIAIGTPTAIASLSGTSSGDTSATLNGTNLTSVASVDISNPAGFSIQDSVGPDAGSFSPLTALVGAPTGTYAGSYSAVSGSALAPAGARASVDNIVSLFPAGDGSAESNVSLTSQFQINLTAATTLAFSFDAEAFLRAYLSLGYGQLGEANGDFNWSMSIRKQVGVNSFQTVVSWKPNGAVSGNGVTGSVGGTETADDFELTQGVSLTNFSADDQLSLSGSFAMTTNTLSAGTYFLTVNHSSDVNAFASPVSEPHVLALAGLTLLGAGFASRRRRA